ncbi:MAG: HEAT repeat domain-containing protein [Gemmatimonadota bacterium]|nr:MAG: HEAT repeat domain-containing protein [Gemmatimonadota bacterium]
MDEAAASNVQTAASLQRKEAYTPLANFTLALIQAMLRTGYYAADHPQAKKSMTGLYAQFAGLVEGRRALTYSLLEKQEHTEITVDGYTEVATPLHQVMVSGMADLFTPKFLDFFSRWKLLSFTLRPDTTQEEFDTFVELMSQVPSGGPIQQANERLTQALIDHDIINISAVFRHEMVGRERRLPWRVRMALTRLRRDLRVLPMYKKATKEQMRRIKLQIIDDTIRPIRTPILLKDFLTNYDLIAADVAELEESQVEREIVANLGEEMLVATAHQIIEELKKLGETDTVATTGEEASVVIGRCVGVLRDVADQLCAIGSVLDHDFLEALVQQKVLPPEQLPVEVRRAIETRRLANAFVRRKDEYLKYLRNPAANDATKKLVATISRITPDLLRRSEYVPVVEIVEVIDEGTKVERMARFFDQVATLLRKELATEAIIGYLLGDLRRQTKEQRDRLVKIIGFIGEAAAAGLLAVYEETDDRALRLSAFEALRKISSKALLPFLSQLPNVETDWAVVRHIITEVAELGDTSLAQPLVAFLYHENPHVRHSSLTALFRLQGAKAEEHFLHAIHDRQAEVRQTAVSHLAAINSRHAQAFEYYNQVLNPDSRSGPKESDAVLIEVCKALSKLAEISPDEAKKSEELLLAALRPVKAKGPLGLLKKAARSHSETVQAAIWEALSALGHEKSA